MKHELECARAEDERQASACAMGDLEKQLYQLREEIGKVTDERDRLREQVAQLTSTPTTVQVMGTVSEENLSARPMCPGGHIFLGNSVLLDRIYCPPLG